MSDSLNPSPYHQSSGSQQVGEGYRIRPRGVGGDNHDPYANRPWTKIGLAMAAIVLVVAAWLIYRQSSQPPSDPRQVVQTLLGQAQDSSCDDTSGYFTDTYEQAGLRWCRGLAGRALSFGRVVAHERGATTTVEAQVFVGGRERTYTVDFTRVDESWRIAAIR